MWTWTREGEVKLWYITNHAVSRMFLLMVRSWFDREKRSYNEFIKAMFAYDNLNP